MCANVIVNGKVRVGVSGFVGTKMAIKQTRTFLLVKH